MMEMKNKAYEYAKKSIDKKTTPKYVKLQMKEFIDICEDKNEKYILSQKKLKQIESILKLLIMPKGIKAGETLYECSVGYQWLIYTAVLCVVYRDKPNRRRYEIGILEICRKNFKTYTIATIFIILFLMGEPFSQYFSVAPDGALSKQIRKAIEETIKSSPLVYEYNGEKRFKILRDYIKFNLNQSTYTPLSFSTSRMDGRMPNCWCCDEAGALNTNYPIEAMQKGQIGVKDKLGFIISTKYNSIQNPLEDEVQYSKKVLDGIINDETRFSLLYEPDKTEGWETDDLILKQSNPVALEIPEIWDDLIQQRALAIAVENKREEFLTKNCNIIYQGQGTETYIDVKDVQKCKVAKLDWRGKVVYLGLDLSESNDNTSVAMVSVDDDNKIQAEVFAFIPEGRIEEKTASEKVKYREFLKSGKVMACGDRVIDYGFVEQFILGLEEQYGVQIQAVAYDRWNCLSTASKLEKNNINCCEVRQHSSVLHPPTKLLKEKILNEEFLYEENKMLEINFQNAKCTYDTNKNQYVNKKKSNGKVDMVVALINAIYLVEQDVFLDNIDFTIQVG
jgi:phage terminase large subunit-like protein